MALTFPSAEWFQALADLANGDEGFRKIGRLDAVVGFRVGGSAWRVAFEVLTCGGVREASEADLREADFVIDMAPEAWRAMLDDIRAHGRATGDFTLNSLDLSADEPIHRNEQGDGYRADKFFRYNPSLQRFFDNAAGLDTAFPEGRPPAPAG